MNHAFVMATEDGEPVVFMVDFRQTITGQQVLDALQAIDDYERRIVFMGHVERLAEHGRRAVKYLPATFPRALADACTEFIRHWQVFRAWHMQRPQLPPDPCIMHFV